MPKSAGEAAFAESGEGGGRWLVFPAGPFATVIHMESFQNVERSRSHGLLKDGSVKV